MLTFDYPVFPDSIFIVNKTMPFNSIAESNKLSAHSLESIDR